MSEKYAEAEEFHAALIAHPAIRRAEGSDGAGTASEVTPHREGAAAFERELTDRMTVTPRAAVPSSGITPGAKNFHTRSGGRSSSGTPVLILLGVILLLALYIGFFNDDGDPPTEGSQGTITNVAGTSSGGEPIPEPSRRSTGPINFFNHAIAGYDALVAGRLTPEIEGGSLATLKSGLQGKGVESAEFAGARLPLIGAVVQTERGKNLAGYLYGDDDTYLFATELPMSLLREEDGFYVSADILAQLENGETVYTPAPSSGTIALFREGETAILVAANRSEPDLAGLIGR